MSAPELPVAETFYTIQGEGPQAGTPAVFLRVGGCNLLCGGPDNPDAPQDELTPDADGATWVCDTIETWRNADTTPLDALAESFDARGWTDILTAGAANLVLTGGEPMLRQDALAEFIERVGVQTVEVETNGTIPPTDVFDTHIDHYNVSLKLPNSGMPEDRRLNPDALGIFTTDERAVFKFVIAEKADLDAVEHIADEYDIPHDRIMFMPTGASRKQLHETYPRVAELCKEWGARFSPRLQIDVWDQATGV